MKRVLILVRVSTWQQETQNQLLQLRQYCEDKNYAVVKEVSENISGGSDKRAGIDTANKLASQAKYVKYD
jgi:DNA invertase Pin-like site-specific DNA recombinase